MVGRIGNGKISSILFSSSGHFIILSLTFSGVQ